MTHTSLNFTPKLSPQCQRLYDRLKLGPITNSQIRDELRLLSYTRLFTDLKAAGIAWQKEYKGNGLFEYSLKKNTSYEDAMDSASKYIDKYKNY